MRGCRWIIVAIGVVFAGMISLGVLKVRYPLRKFDQIQLGMQLDDVERLLGNQSTIRLLVSSENHSAIVNHCYRVGIWDIDVYMISGHVTSKEIEFRLACLSAENPGP